MEKPTLAEILQQHGRFVRRTLSSLGVCSREVDDVTQHVWRGVHRGLPAFDPSKAAQPTTAMRAWLFGICQRQAASHRRNQRRRAEELRDTREIDLLPARMLGAEDQLVARDEDAHLESILAEIEPALRAVFAAHELHGISMAEIARAQGVPVNTAWNRLRLAREEIRAAWDRHKRNKKS